jgi:hypothetical protein
MVDVIIDCHTLSSFHMVRTPALAASGLYTPAAPPIKAYHMHTIIGVDMNIDTSQRRDR